MRRVVAVQRFIRWVGAARQRQCIVAASIAAVVAIKSRRRCPAATSADISLRGAAVLVIHQPRARRRGGVFEVVPNVRRHRRGGDGDTLAEPPAASRLLHRRGVLAITAVAVGVGGRCWRKRRQALPRQAVGGERAMEREVSVRHRPIVRIIVRKVVITVAF